MSAPLREQHVNDGLTTLNGAIDSSQTSVVVTTGSVLPSTGNFRVMVDSEIMIVTARSTNTLTVVRGQDGTSGASHSDLAPIAMIYSTEGLTSLFKDADGLFGYGSVKPQGRLFADDGATILAASDFTWINQGGATVTDEDGTIILMCPTDSGRNIRGLERNAPSTPYTYIGAFRTACGGLDTDAAPSFGMGFRETSSGKFMTLRYDSESFFGSQHSVLVSRYSDSSTLFTNNLGPKNIHIKSPLVWFKIENDGTNTKYYVGPDGFNWILFLSEGKTTYFSGNPDKVFWFGSNVGNSGTGATELYVRLHHWSKGE